MLPASVAAFFTRKPALPVVPVPPAVVAMPPVAAHCQDGPRAPSPHSLPGRPNLGAYVIATTCTTTKACPLTGLRRMENHCDALEAVSHGLRALSDSLVIGGSLERVDGHATAAAILEALAVDVDMARQRVELVAFSEFYGERGA